jgi:hypothetical protein
MEYEVVLTEKAERELAALPVFLQEPVESHLIVLASSPAAVARKVVSPPYPPGGMMSEFDVGPLGDTLHHVAVFFRYSQDETQIIVFAIGYSALRVSDSE